MKKVLLFLIGVVAGGLLVYFLLPNTFKSKKAVSDLEERIERLELQENEVEIPEKYIL